MSSVPQIEGLTVEDFLKFAKTVPNALKYLPNEEDWLHIDKRWLCDVLYSLDPNGVEEMITNARAKQRQRKEEKHDLLVNIRPEFAEAFKNSTSFSSKGRSLNPVFRSKRQGCLHDEEQCQEKATRPRTGGSQE